MPAPSRSISSSASAAAVPASPRPGSGGSNKAKGEASPARLIDARIAALSDWRGETLARIRALIKDACPEAVEA
jgi:hypothetical protein